MKASLELAHFALGLCFLCFTTVLGNWEEWWTYDGISGPDFWGLLNPDWNLCSKGRRQSPVDLNPNTLLFDPHLKPLHVDKSRISGIITNTGHGVIFRVSDSLAPGLAVNISGGPLSYQYRFHELHIHYGRSDDRGSEHTIAGKPFPAELQIFGYNSDLYANMSEAVELRRSEGLVGISILLQLGDLSQSELRVLTGQLHRITYRGKQMRKSVEKFASSCCMVHNNKSYIQTTTNLQKGTTLEWVFRDVLFSNLSRLKLNYNLF